MATPAERVVRGLADEGIKDLERQIALEESKLRPNQQTLSNLKAHLTTARGKQVAATEFPVVGKSFGGRSKNLETEIKPDNPKFGQEKPAFGSKAAKREFESSGGIRTAVKRGKDVGYGEMHYQAYDDLAEKTGISFDELVDAAYDPVTGEPTKEVIEGFQGRSGKVYTRKEMGERRGMGKHSKFMSSEQIAGEMEEESPAMKRRIARSEGSTDPKEHYHRRMQAKKANEYLRKINEEKKLLTKPRPNTRMSPEALRILENEARFKPGAAIAFRRAVGGRLGTLVRRAGILKTLGRKAGVLSLVATPYTTGEALVGLASDDENERLRSLETLYGIPDGMSGRGMTKKEKKETPIWYDPKTFTWKM